MDTHARPRWLTLVISLPGQRGTARMRVWRSLKATGAAVLRDGVYLLPDTSAAHAAFEKQARVIRAAGGSAHVLRLDEVAREQEQTFRALFDRASEYGPLIDALNKLRSTLARRRSPQASKQVRAIRRAFQSLYAADHFPGAAAEQTAQRLSEVEALVAALASPDEPRAHDGAIAALDRRAYRGRTWATRARPWVDRLASAWLIKRFIDPKGKILWLMDIKKIPKRGLGFDFDGATFTHVGSRVTFETLLASFDLERDGALTRIGQLVHCLDVGGAPVAEAQGLATILAGARARLSKDDALLAEASRIFDSLYVAYQEE